MPATFLILLAGGLMLAIATTPRRVGVRSDRRLALLSLVSCAAACVFYALRTEVADTPPFFRRIQAGLVVATLALTIGGFALGLTRAVVTQRVVAFAVFVVAVLAGSNLLHDLMLLRGTAVVFPPKALSVGLQTLASAGTAAMAGMAMARAITPGAAMPTSAAAAPLGRDGRALTAAFALRSILSIGAFLLLQAWRPVPMLWAGDGTIIAVRWVLGLLVPAVLFHAASRRGYSSGWRANGAVAAYAVAVLVLVGEWLALDLVRRTGLPF